MNRRVVLPDNDLINFIRDRLRTGAAGGNVIIILDTVAMTYTYCVHKAQEYVSFSLLSHPPSIANTFTHLRLGENSRNERHCHGSLPTQCAEDAYRLHRVK